MAQKEYKRPDEATLLRILDSNQLLLAETLIVLAWRLGLSRDEIYNLKWADFSFEERQVSLPDRCIPLDEEAYTRLYRRWEEQEHHGVYVASSDRIGERVHPNYIPRCVRKALNEGGLPDINMVDLRQDFVLRLLQEHPRPYVARVTGITATSLYASYSEYFADEAKKGEGEEAEQSSDIEFRLWKIIQEEGASVEGLALWLAWTLEIPIQELTELTWDQVDLAKGMIKLPDRKVKMGSAILRKLKEVKAERGPDSDPHVLLTPRAQKGFDAKRLSKVLRNVLIRGGVDITLQDILSTKKRNDSEYPIIRIVQKYGSATRNQIMTELPLSQAQYYARVESLIERGELVRIGQKLYLPGTVVAPEEQYEVIRAHLETVSGAVRSDLAALLHVSSNQCGVILRTLVKEGKLKHTGHVYSLPDKDEIV